MTNKDGGPAISDLVFKLRLLWAFTSRAYIEWREAIWERDLDSNYCCNGRACGCYGESVRNIYSAMLAERERDGDG